MHIHIMPFEGLDEGFATVGDSGNAMTGCGLKVILGTTSGPAGLLRHEAQSAASREETIDQTDAAAGCTAATQ